MPCFRCKTTKKKIVKKRKKMTLSPQRRGNVTSVVPLQRRPPLDKKAALRSKIQDILSGRSRFVIRKPSTMRKPSSNNDPISSKVQEKTRVSSLPSVSRSNEEVKKNR